MHFPRNFRLALLCAATLACSKDPNAPDAKTSITGRWVSTDTVEVFTGLDLRVVQSETGVLSGNWEGKTRITNGKCDATFGCAPRNTIGGTNVSLRIDMEILGVGSYSGQLMTKDLMFGQIVRFGVNYPLRLRRVD